MELSLPRPIDERDNVTFELSIATGWKTGPVKDKQARWEPAELSAVVSELIGISPAAQKVYGT